MIDNFFETTDNICYNPVKESDSNMSYVIMMKCTDGIVCASDSRLTTTIQNDKQTIQTLRNDNATKVFKNSSLIIGVFGSYDVGNQTIDVIINNILNNVSTMFEFIEEFSSQIVDSKVYSMFIGEKIGNSYEAFSVKISKTKIEIEKFRANYYNSNVTDFADKLIPLGIKFVSVSMAKPLLISTIQNVIDLQNNLLNYAVVGGNIQCEILQ